MDSDPGAPASASLRHYLSVLRTQWILVALVTLTAVAVAAGYSLLQDPVYKAQAELSFADRSEALSLLGTPTAPSQRPEKDSAANAKAVTRPAVTEAVKRTLSLATPTADLQQLVKARVDPDSDLVIVEADSPEARRAADLANEYARQAVRIETERDRSQYATAARSLQRRLGAIGRGPNRDVERAAYLDRISRLFSLASFAKPVELARQAETPSSPASPKPLRNMVLAGLLGLILGSGAAFVRSSLDRRLRDAHQVEHELGLPVLAHVRTEALGRRLASSNGHPGGLEAPDLEVFRILRSNVDFLDPDHPVRSLVVTSPLPEEGKSTVAASLAYTCALGGKRTLLVETDLRRPSLADRLDLEPRPGLADYLAGSASPAEVVQKVEAPMAAQVANGNSRLFKEEGGAVSLACIVAGGPSPRPAEQLASTRFSDFLREVSEVYDLVILDSAPLLPVGDTLEVLPHVEAALVCVRMSQTTRDQALAAKSALSHLPGNATAVVVTGVKPGSGGYNGYYSYSYE